MINYNYNNNNSSNNNVLNYPRPWPRGARMVVGEGSTSSRWYRTFRYNFTKLTISLHYVFWIRHIVSCGHQVFNCQILYYLMI